MQAYMKSAMPYHGVPAPALRQLCNTVFADMQFPRRWFGRAQCWICGEGTVSGRSVTRHCTWQEIGAPRLSKRPLR